MFEVFQRPRLAGKYAGIDIATVRDTLLYIESDLARSPDHERLAAVIRQALAEIDRLESSNGNIEHLPVAAVRFLPATF